MSLGTGRSLKNRLLIPMVVILALFASGTARANHENIVIDGNLTDLISAINNNLGPTNGGFTSTDPVGDIYTGDCSYINGYDIAQTYFFLDFQDEDGQATPDDLTLYIGWTLNGTIGDVDGDGNPNTFDPFGPGGSTGCAIAEESGIGNNESYNLLLDLDCVGGVDDIRIQVKNNSILRLANNAVTMIPDATFAVSGDNLELRIPNYQNLLAGLNSTADPCDARFRFSANAGFDGLAEDITSAFTLSLDPSIAVEIDPPTQLLCAGSTASWNITATNDGVCRLNNVTIESVLGAGMSFISSNSTPTSVVGQTVRWVFTGINLAPGETIDLTLSAATQSPCVSTTMANNVSANGVHITPCLPNGTPSPTTSDTDDATVTCRDLPVCEINGDDHTMFPASEIYTTTVTSPFARTWSISSTPPGICNSTDPLTGSTIEVNYTGAGICTLSLTIRDPLNPQVCTTTCNFLVEVIAMEPCIISGQDEACEGSSQTFTTEAGPRYGKTWTATSTPDDICEIIGTNTGNQVLVHFTGVGQCTVKLVLFDKEDPTDCVTICTQVINIEDCIGDEDPYSVMGEGCLLETASSGRMEHTFGGNVNPASAGSWQHRVEQRNRTEFTFTAVDARVDSCFDDGFVGTCTPHGEFNSIAWSGTGQFSIRGGRTNAGGTFTACMRECDSDDFYEITVFDLNQTVVFTTSGFISCGNLEMPEFHAIQGIKPINNVGGPSGNPSPGDGQGQLTTRPFPNPVTSNSASIDYSIPTRLASAAVGITIFDVTGRVVRSLNPGNQPAGNYSADWDLRDEDGITVTSGIYFYRLTVGTESVTEKLMVVRK